MKLFPNFSTFLQIGSIEIRWYAVCIVTGALIALYLVASAAKKDGYDFEIFEDIFIGVMFFGVIGARMWFVLFFDLDTYLADPISILRIWDGGLAIHGGLLFGLIFVYIYCTVKNISFMKMADYIPPAVLVAQAAGRWGNFFNKECHGQLVDESYFDGILSFLKEGMHINGKYYEPMFFYESVLCIIGAVLLIVLRNTKSYHRGDCLFGYLGWYGAVRFWIESRRTDALLVGNFKIAQIASIIFIIIGVAGLFGLFRKFIKEEKPVIIFDLDGTLLDTYPLIVESFAHVFKKYKPDFELTDEIKASFLGPTLRQTFERYIPEGPVDEMIDMYRQHNIKAQKKVKAFPNVAELLEYLNENGYKMAIASSKVLTTINAGLENTDLKKYFPDDVIVDADAVSVPKPDKQCIIMALKRIGGRIDNAIYVGDCDTDIIASKNAGVYSIAYNTNPLKRNDLEKQNPNNLIEDIGDIKEILKGEHPWNYNMK